MSHMVEISHHDKADEVEYKLVKKCNGRDVTALQFGDSTVAQEGLRGANQDEEV